MNFDTVEDPIRRGQLAGEVINNPLWEEVWTLLREQYVNNLELTRPRDDVERFRYTEALKIIKAIKGHYESVLAHGLQAMEQAKLHDEGIKERLARLF